MFPHPVGPITRTILNRACTVVNNNLVILPARWYSPLMDVREMARLGGLARAQSMTPDERRKSAMKAAKAAGLVHKKKKAKRKKTATQK